ncbi:MAG: hypothetical protein KDA16_12570, partial [Phycisphaerales bacterium]|nr:hypothetical protein [Phycisphaerales bacterium]
MGRKKRVFAAISPEGRITREEGVKEFADLHGLDSAAVSACIAGRAGSHKGWKFREATIHDPPLAIEGETPESEPPKESEVASALAASSTLTREQRIERALKMRENLISTHAQILAGVKEMPVGWNPDRMMKPIESELKACGVSLEGAIDERTPEEKAADAIDRLIETPESMWSINDGDLDAIEAAMTRALTDGEEYIEEIAAAKAQKRAGKQVTPGKAMAARAWTNRLRRLRTIRSWVRHERPEEYHQWGASKRLAWDGTRVLRYQVYVGRADAADSGAGGSGYIFQFGRPHVKMAIDLYRAWRKIAITADGVLRPGDIMPSSGRAFPGIPYQGCMELYPPRHGKSAFLRHVVGLTMGTNPRLQGAYVHARRDEASRFIKYVSDFFDPDTGAGARHLSLFPQELASYDNNATKIRLSIPEPTSNPTFLGAGVWD